MILPVGKRLKNMTFITLGLGQPSLSKAQVTFMGTPVQGRLDQRQYKKELTLIWEGAGCSYQAGLAHIDEAPYCPCNYTCASPSRVSII